MKWLIATLTVTLAGQISVNADTKQTYKPTWESLAKHEAAPEWLKDAKLGIYFHWGVYSVPAFGNEMVSAMDALQTP